LPSEVKIAARRIASVNPATLEALQEFDCADEPEVHAAVERARLAQEDWERLGVGWRVQILRRFQELLHRRKSEVARVITRESGTPYVEALLTEVLVVLDAVRFCAENSYAFMRAEAVPHGNLAMKAKRGQIIREPHGVLGIISPWNYPFAIPATESLAALACGNAVVLKPSELTSMSALELQSLFQEAGVPGDVFRVVVGDGITGGALVSSELDKLIFTGSVASGKRVAQTAASRLLPVVLELGGKDPMLVLDDASVEIASSAAVWGAFVNAGQACLSVERCYVHRNVYEKFLEACVAKTRKLRVGNGLDPEIDIGPMIHSRQLQIVAAHVEDAAEKGARVLVGGSRLPQLGPNFYAPTVIGDVNHNMRLMREETFGPVLPVMPFDTDDEAVDLANDSEFGLAASIWTANAGRGQALAARLHTGTVMVNDVISCFGISEAPHGGVRSSGWGRTHGRAGLEEMVRLKYVDCDRLPGVRKVWWFGYGEDFSRQMEGFVDFLFARGWLARIRGAIHSVKAYWRKGWL
jgi:acyl-CoA reductase-like NAD-dependent aldehyde dehydrogenase